MLLFLQMRIVSLIAVLVSSLYSFRCSSTIWVNKTYWFIMLLFSPFVRILILALIAISFPLKNSSEREIVVLLIFLEPV